MLASWCRIILGRPSRRHGSPGTTPFRFRPRLEGLEDRDVLSVAGPLPVFELTGHALTAFSGVPTVGIVATFRAEDDGVPLSASIDWGDGQESVGLVAFVSADLYSVRGTNTYSSAGSFTITVAVAWGAEEVVSVTATAFVTVMPGGELSGPGYAGGLTQNNADGVGTPSPPPIPQEGPPAGPARGGASVQHAFLNLRGQVIVTSSAVDHGVPWRRGPDHGPPRPEVAAALPAQPGPGAIASVAVGARPVSLVSSESSISFAGNSGTGRSTFALGLRITVRGPQVAVVVERASTAGPVAANVTRSDPSTGEIALPGMDVADEEPGGVYWDRLAQLQDASQSAGTLTCGDLPLHEAERARPQPDGPARHDWQWGLGLACLLAQSLAVACWDRRTDSPEDVPRRGNLPVG
jgi:hypothetical protein